MLFLRLQGWLTARHSIALQSELCQAAYSPARTRFPYNLLKIRIFALPFFSVLLACLSQPASAELAQPTSVQVPINLGAAASIDGQTFQTADGTQFSCSAGQSASSGCILSGNSVQVPEFTYVDSSGNTLYGSIIEFVFGYSVYSQQITGISFTADLSQPNPIGPDGNPDPVQGTVYYQSATSGSPAFSQETIAFATGTNPFSITAPAGQVIVGFAVGSSDVTTPGVVLGVSNLVLSIEGQKAGLSVAGAHFWQVVKDPRIAWLTNPSASGPIDVVQGKSASFELRLEGSNLSAANGTIVIRASDGNRTISSSNPIDLEVIAAAVSKQGYFELTPANFSAYFPIQLGTNNITFFIDTSSASSNLTTTSDADLVLNVHGTFTPQIGTVTINQSLLANCLFSPYGGCIGSPAASDINSTLGIAGEMTREYPVREDIGGRFVFYTSHPAITGSTSADPVEAVDADALQLHQIKIQDPIHFQRIVGLVSPAYFSMREPGKNLAGEQDIGGYNGVVMVQAGSHHVLPHEIAHSLGQLNEGYCTKDPLRPSISQCPSSAQRNTYDKTPVNGYDAVTKSCFQWDNGVLNNQSCLLARTIMGPNNGSPNYWIDQQTYLKVFSTLLSPPSDPEVFVVSGLLNTSGQFTFSSSFELPNGTLTQSVEGGDVTISSLDSNENLINKVTVQSNFTAIGIPEDGSATPTTIPLTSIPVLVSLPLSPSADVIQVSTLSGAVVSKSHVSGRLLQGFINDIPDNAFKVREDRREGDDRDGDHHRDRFVPANAQQISDFRNLFSSKVTEIQRQLSSKNSEGVEGLLRELEKIVERITFDDYTVVNAAQLTQAQVLADIDALIYRVENSKKTHGKHEE